MTVIRSQAFQNARKSTGQNTYYRRKGVQLVRSKATFAPGRTFTNPQKVCQANMAAVQFLLTEGQANKWANCCNISNKKRYNASTQINKLTSQLLNGIPRNLVDVNASAQSNACLVAENAFSNFCYGSTELVPSKMAIEFPVEATPFSCFLQVLMDKDTVDAFLLRMKQRLRLKRNFDYYDLGVLAIVLKSITGEVSKQNVYIGEPTLLDSEGPSGDMPGLYEFQWLVDYTPISAGTEDGSVNVYFCLFLADYHDATNRVPNGKAYWNSAPFMCLNASEAGFNNVKFAQ